MMKDEDINFSHKPVLLDECINMLNIIPNGIYVDGTLGGAGHSSEILKRLGTGGKLLGLDQDSEALKIATTRLARIETKAEYFTVKTNFVNLIDACTEKDIKNVNGILLDIGVSSYQFDTAERGFSYRFDSPLDMRMDRDNKLTAADVVNTYSGDRITSILRDYGEEKWAARISKFILEKRKTEPINTTEQLVEIIKAAIPAAARKDGGHPAKRTFQAIRIEVNKELDVLERVIDDAISILAPGGRLCIITFQSLEDRIVKNKFKNAANPCTCPKDFPVCVCGKQPKGKVLTGKPIEASDTELGDNPRSQSAKLRVFERA